MFAKGDGSVRLEAATHKLTIYAPGTTSAERQANVLMVTDPLEPANALAEPFGKGEPLGVALGPSSVCP